MDHVRTDAVLTTDDQIKITPPRQAIDYNGTPIQVPWVLTLGMYSLNVISLRTSQENLARLRDAIDAALDGGEPDSRPHPDEVDL